MRTWTMPLIATSRNSKLKRMLLSVCPYHPSPRKSEDLTKNLLLPLFPTPPQPLWGVDGIIGMGQE